MRLTAYIVLTIGLLTPINTASANESSLYVPIDASACNIPVDGMHARYSDHDLSVIECPANINLHALPLRLFIVSTEERSWIDLMLGNTLWSSEDEVVYEKDNQFGHFPNIGKTPVEIRTRNHNAIGVIFRVKALAFENDAQKPHESRVSRLFVLGFRKSGLCFLGLTHENSTARHLLDSRTECIRMLKAESLQ
ncbi:MAG: hypothetical protein KF888_01615 [Nitrosomonas sp.]|nr:hypothetical protein [Nitrosomonas sp.]